MNTQFDEEREEEVLIFSLQSSFFSLPASFRRRKKDLISFSGEEEEEGE